jgi:outer membrane protein assembly factor BamB
MAAGNWRLEIMRQLILMSYPRRIFDCVFSYLLLGLIGFAPLATADDWTQWRGNHRDGKWRESEVLSQLTESNLKTLWRQPISAGYSGPTVANGRVFLMDRETEPAQTESVRCFDAKSGTPLWRHSYDAVYTISYAAGPRASVTIDGDKCYALGAMGHLHCLNVKDGTVVWQRNLNEEYGVSDTKRMPIWGIACSPIVYGDQLIVQLGAEGATVISLDKLTGKEKWRALNDRGQYSSPVLTQQKGNDVLVCWTGDAVAGLNPGNGEVYWRHEFRPSRMPIGVATPVINGNKIFLTSFYDGSMMLEMNPNEMTVQQLWAAKGPNERTTKALHSIISTPIWIGDHIYGVDSYGELRCIRASDGERVWENQDAVPRNRWGTIHFVSRESDVWMFNEQGEMIVGRLNPEGLQQISRVKIIEPTQPQLPNRKGGVCWSHPAFASRCVFVRNDQEIVCIDLSN